MNDTDSLLVFRLQRLRNQPKTIRGRCILFYASLNDRPCARIMLAIGFIFFVMAHALAFCSMLYACYSVSWPPGSLAQRCCLMMALLLFLF